MPGLINLDFADVRSVMNEMGKAMMGTGEADGPNRALEAAERAIANPLLDGVSMQGAKGVIISIIGGEDMKLLEVDEAANHIRELVDPEANIIWGSAFNPDLDGKIRVSVVATGIEQSADRVQNPHQPLGLGGSRGPRRSILPEAAAAPAGASLGGYGSSADQSGSGFSLDSTPAEVAHQAPIIDVEDEPLDLSEPFAPEEEGADEAIADPADDSHFGQHPGDGFGSLSGMHDAPAGDTPGDEDDEAFELTTEAEAMPPAQDELLLDAGRLAQADVDNEPAVTGRRRRFFGGGDDESEAASTPPAPAPAPTPVAPAAPAAGSTLFERMANLSRANTSPEEDEEEDGGSALRIPRFLGRTNNQ
jgi:cell division protein FtsZ